MSGCQCKQNFAFPEYHWPHCPFNTNRHAPAASKNKLGEEARVLTAVSQPAKQARKKRVRP